MAEAVDAILAVTGMHCANCGLLIDETLADLPGVQSVTTDVADGRTLLRFDPEQLGIDQLTATIAELGYTATVAG